MLKKIVFVLLGIVTQQVVAQQVVSTEDFEINLSEGWSYHCREIEGVVKHFFDRNSLSYTVVIFPVPMYTHKAFMEYCPWGTDYVESEGEQIVGLEDSTEIRYRKVQGNVLEPNVSGCVYVTDRNDKTIIIQEIYKDASQAVKDSLLDKFRWAKIASLSFSERVDRFCRALNGVMGKYAPSLGMNLRQSANDKMLYKEQWLKSSKDEAKALAEGKLQKEENTIRSYFEFSPLFLEMGKKGYSFQESRYLMNGELESSIVYKPGDYKHLLMEYTEMRRNKK